MIGNTNAIPSKVEDISNTWLSPLSGVTAYDVGIYRQGEHIFGNILLSYPASTANTQFNVGTIGGGYAPIVNINTFCAMSNYRYGTGIAVGYAYLGADGTVTLNAPTSTTWAKLHIDYMAR